MTRKKIERRRQQEVSAKRETDFAYCQDVAASDKDFGADVRIQLMAEHIAEIAEETGFISLTHFANFIKRMTGKTAREIRRGG